MKIIVDAERKDNCDYAVHTKVVGDFKVIYGNYHAYIPKINWNGTDTVFNWGDISDNFIKRFCVQNIYPNGETMTLKGKKYEIPNGAYLTYNNKLEMQICYQNEVCSIDGLVFDKLKLNKQGLLKVDEDAYFTDLHNPNNGYYTFVGYIADELQALGQISVIEYGTIKKHIYEPQTVAIKDVDGQCIFVGSGTVNLEWQEDSETITRTFEAGTLIMLSDKEIKVTGGSNYNVYELYSVKDKTDLYTLHGKNDSFAE